MTAPDHLAAVPWPVRTERLTIRRSRDADAEAVYAYQRAEGVTEWLRYRTPPWPQFRELFTDPDRSATRVVLERNARVVGDMKVCISDAWAQADVAEQAAGTECELGWIIDPACQGQGIATEAVHAVIDAVYMHTPVRRIVAYAFADNLASTRVMAKVGMREEGRFVKESLHRTRGWLDGTTWAVLREGWEAAQASR